MANFARDFVAGASMARTASDIREKRVKARDERAYGLQQAQREQAALDSRQSLDAAIGERLTRPFRLQGEGDAAGAPGPSPTQGPAKAAMPAPAAGQAPTRAPAPGAQGGSFWGQALDYMGFGPGTPVKPGSGATLDQEDLLGVPAGDYAQAADGGGLASRYGAPATPASLLRSGGLGSLLARLGNRLNPQAAPMGGGSMAQPGTPDGSLVAQTGPARGSAGGWQPPAPTEQALALARAYAPQYGLTVPQALAKMGIESSFNPSAISEDGAVGLAQVLPSTFKEVLPGGNIRNPADNVRAGLAYLAQQRDAFGGDMTRAVRAYNAGPTAERSGRAARYPETQQHVRRYLQALDAYRNYG